MASSETPDVHDSVWPVALGQWIPWQTVAKEVERVRAKEFEPDEVCVHDGGGVTVQLGIVVRFRAAS
jgi:hypothetical protein